MPTSQSAKKRMLTSEVSRQRNQAVRTRVRSAGKMIDEVVAAGDAVKSKQAMSDYFSILDKAAKKGVISPNAASRRKSRATKKLSAKSA
jgi:small subunit ribosomal protein S20